MDIRLLIILLSPPPGIDFGLQKGAGSDYEPVQVQRSSSTDLSFKLSAEVRGDRSKDAIPDFKGPFVQGPVNGRFIYIDIGSLAGQAGQPAWRLKIPLTGVTWEMVERLKADPTMQLETKVAGTHKNGGPNCATVKPFDGWTVKIA